VSAKRSLFILFLTVLAGWAIVSCGQNRWHPTDPRLDPPDTSRITIDDSWTIGIGTTVTAAAAASPASLP
jgi:hypothetical protein